MLLDINQIETEEGSHHEDVPVGGLIKADGPIDHGITYKAIKA